MKKLFVLLVLFSNGFCYSQDSQDSIGKKSSFIGKASIKSGTILKKEFIDIYTYTPKGIFTQFGLIQVQILNITDATTNAKVTGLKFSNGESAFLDVDEVPGIIKFIEMLNKIDSEKPTNYTEYNYYFRDLKIYSYYSPIVTKRESPGWHFGIDTNSGFSGGSSAIELKTLIEIKDAILANKDKFAETIKL